MKKLVATAVAAATAAFAFTTPSEAHCGCSVHYVRPHYVVVQPRYKDCFTRKIRRINRHGNLVIKFRTVCG